MNQHTFSIKFAGGARRVVTAFNEEEAIILAQAKQIESAGVWRHVIDICILS